MGSIQHDYFNLDLLPSLHTFIVICAAYFWCVESTGVITLSNPHEGCSRLQLTSPMLPDVALFMPDSTRNVGDSRLSGDDSQLRGWDLNPHGIGYEPIELPVLYRAMFQHLLNMPI